MSDDLLDVLTGGKQKSEPADPVDYAIRTTYGEAGADRASRQAVAAVIHNRATHSGKTYDQVVTEPGQFEPWGDPKARARMLALSKDSPEYKAIEADIAPVLKGEVTLPYTHFYSPGLMKARRQPPPAWDDGSGQNIGGQLFFAKPDQGGEADLSAVLGAGGLDDKKAQAAYQAAFAPIEQHDLPPIPGSELSEVYYGTPGQRIAAGGVQGLRDVGASINNLLGPAVRAAQANPLLRTIGNLEGASYLGVPAKSVPWAETAQHDIAARNAFDSRYGADPEATAGRLGGNMLGTLPAMALGGEAVAPAAAVLRAIPAAAPVADFIAGTAGRGGAGIGNLLLRGGSRAAQGAVQGAVQGAEASALNSSTSDVPVGQQMASGALLGGVAGAAMPIIANAGVRGANALMNPQTGITPAVRGLAQAAVDDYGIPLRASQIKGVGNREMAVADSQRLSKFGTGYAENNAQQRKAFTQAVAKTFGETADALTPDVMQRARDRIGGEFDRVAANTTIADGDGLLTNLGNVVRDASMTLPEGEVAPLLRQVEQIGSTLDPATRSLSGDSYQALTRKGSPLDRAANSANPNLRFYAQQMRETLDDALHASASPEDAQALSAARWQYKNLMTVKNLAAKANVEGEISPALLNGAVNTSFKNRAFKGAGDLGELAQIGQTFMKEPPNSGTAARLRDMLLPGMMGGAGVADLALAFHDPMLAGKLAAGAGLVGGARAVSNGVVGAYNRSPAVINQLLRARPASPAVSAMGQGAGRLNDLMTPAYIPLGVLGYDRFGGQPLPAGQ